MTDKTVNAHAAKTTLSAPLADIEHGADVTIARLVRVSDVPERQPGPLAGTPGWADFRYDPALFAPLTPAELAAEGWELPPAASPAPVRPASCRTPIG